MGWAIEKLNISSDRARRVALGKQMELLEQVSKRIAGGITLVGSYVL